MVVWKAFSGSIKMMHSIELKHDVSYCMIYFNIHLISISSALRWEDNREVLRWIHYKTGTIAKHWLVFPLLNYSVVPCSVFNIHCYPFFVRESGHFCSRFGSHPSGVL
ncbi:MAG: hypothetical protein C0403_11890 [Desulfobacterium sp.]|nr:hypothetical protein [Desulfobacterium sp.]